VSGHFVISLDFELLWGVRDHSDRISYGRNILGARDAVPRMLDLFAENGVHATWATVGFLFCESKEELIDCMPEDDRPMYANPALSNYRYFGEVGRNESADPYYFAPSLIETIRQTPGQEIGTHTLSHYYCLEDGQTLEAFEADLRAAQRLASRRGVTLRSIVFPRNQFGPEHLEVCKRQGLTTYRGNPEGWAYRAAKGAEQTPLRRALRLADAYTGFLGPLTFGRAGGVLENVPASRFLRPCAGRLAPFHQSHIATIRREMSAAAQSGAGYHLWWHPHNFGRNLEANLDGLRQIISHFRQLRDAFGMASRTMADFA
jgi:peptidoglycan/xylan/chitin deacetylase (PgdA/CDA1 family)